MSEPDLSFTEHPDNLQHFNAQDWSVLFLLLDAALDWRSANEREALLAQVDRDAPLYGKPLRHLLAIHAEVDANSFLNRGAPLAPGQKK